LELNIHVIRAAIKLSADKHLCFISDDSIKFSHQTAALLIGEVSDPMNSKLFYERRFEPSTGHTARIKKKGQQSLSFKCLSDLTTDPFGHK